MRHLSMIDLAARSYALENRLLATNSVDPSAVSGYFISSNVPVCPAGAVPYGRFVIRDGPFCPNDPAHNRAFKALRTNWTNEAFYRTF